MQNGRRTALFPLADAIVKAQDEFVVVAIFEEVFLRGRDWIGLWIEWFVVRGTDQVAIRCQLDDVWYEIVCDFEEFLVDFLVVTTVIVAVTKNLNEL